MQWIRVRNATSLWHDIIKYNKKNIYKCTDYDSSLRMKTLNHTELMSCSSAMGRQLGKVENIFACWVFFCKKSHFGIWNIKCFIKGNVELLIAKGYQEVARWLKTMSLCYIGVIWSMVISADMTPHVIHPVYSMLALIKEEHAVCKVVNTWLTNTSSSRLVV